MLEKARRQDSRNLLEIDRYFEHHVMTKLTAPQAPPRCVEVTKRAMSAVCLSWAALPPEDVKIQNHNAT